MDYILEIDDNISREMCDKIISRFNKDERKKPGVVMFNKLDANFETKKVKTSIDLNLSNYVKDSTGVYWDDIDAYLHNKLNEGLCKYKEYIENIYATKSMPRISTWSSHLEELYDRGYQIQMTEKDGFYLWHDDSSPSTGRELTYIWYLNDLNDEDGGTTDFECGKRIKPKAGKLVIFPATWTYIHCGRPVLTDVKKYICTGWLCCNRK